jgi:hypothetical protein
MQFLKWKGTLAACLLLAACTGGLSPSLKQQISAEAERLSDSRAQVAAAQSAVEKDLASDPELFQSAAAPDIWKANLKSAARELDNASRSDRTLDELARENRADSAPRVERLIAEEKRLRMGAVNEARAARTEAEKWIAFKASLPAKLSELQREYDSAGGSDLASVATLVTKAGTDWPSKRTFLQTRLDELHNTTADAAKQWAASETARAHASNHSASGADIATLIQTEEALRSDDAELQTGSEKLRALSGQLYDSWDKILIDLDVSNFENDHLYRERIKTIRTHLTDPASKQGTSSASEQWITVSEPQFRNVEHDLGMAIAHKDAGLFDFEAQTVPQPAGFAYIASEQQGSNQYGYWAHDNGASVWHWLPEDLILRELLWNHDYRPVVLSEYRGYQAARSAGRSFYGQTTPSAPPKYGTAGTYTAAHYAGSHYVQSGAYKGSAYASSHTPSFEGATPAAPETLSKSSGAGKRFGFGTGISSGRRFGGGGIGKRFGGGRR